MPSKRDPDQLDLIAWAESRPVAVAKPSGEIIRAIRIYDKKRIAFARLLICGYKPPRKEGKIFILDDYLDGRSPSSDGPGAPTRADGPLRARKKAASS